MFRIVHTEQSIRLLRTKLMDSQGYIFVDGVSLPILASPNKVYSFISFSFHIMKKYPMIVRAPP